MTAALAMMADSIEHVISYWILYEKFRSPALGGIAILTHWLPFLFFSVYSGALAERFDLRRIIQAGMLLFMSASLGWGLLIVTDALEIWHAVVLLTIHGFAGVAWAGAGQLLIHEIVGPDQLQSAVRLSSSSRYLGLLLGPAVGGGLMIALGPSGGLLVNVIIYLPLFWWLRRVNYGARRHQTRAARAQRPARGGGVAEILAGLREITRNRTILSMTLLAGGASLIVGNAYQAQMPEFAHDLGHADADFFYSVLLAADAVGALTAGLVLESRGLLQARPRTAMSLAALWCLCIGGFAAATSYPLAVALLFMAGFFNLAFSAMAQTLVQLHSPENLRGRVIGLFNMSSLGLRAFSGVTVGILGSLIGIHWSLAISAMTLLAASMGLLALSMRRD
jgi:MFS family permease